MLTAKKPSGPVTYAISKGADVFPFRVFWAFLQRMFS
jgi:hypothetical protein